MADEIRALQVNKTGEGQTVDFVTLSEAGLGEGAPRTFPDRQRGGKARPATRSKQRSQATIGG